MKNLLIITIILTLVGCESMSDEDYIWLEEIDGKEALDWVKARNAETLAQFGESQKYDSLIDDMVELMDDKKRIPWPRLRGKYIYNFWADAKNPKGIWRRTTLTSYLTKNPEWIVLLDVDELAAKEGKSWVFKGVKMFYPDQKRCLVMLSPGGSDASETREFDLEKKQFIKEGFYIPVNKGAATWLDEDTLLISTTLKEEDKTDSGYANQVRIWQRGTDINSAKEVFKGEKNDVSSWSFRLGKPERKIFVFGQSKTFYKREYYFWNRETGKQTRIPIPEDSTIEGLQDNHLFVELKSAWQGFAAGSLVSLDFNQLRKGDVKVLPVYTPTKRSSLNGFTWTKNSLYINTIEDVKGKVFKVDFKGGEWQHELIPLPENGTVSIVTADDETDSILFSYQSFLKNSTLYYFDGENLDESYTTDAKFDAGPYITEQYFAVSKDGTKVPYFIVHRKDMKFDGHNPTLLNGYGGFQISLLPYYSSFAGRFWLEKGGVFVRANIRGGGEYGPKWHQSAIKLNKHKSYEDFIAVAEDLMARKVTSPAKLAIKGGSNGGLLMGVMLTQRPDLFKGVICQVPLLDMGRFHKLLAGASWMGEYGNPDVEKEREYIMTYSPFQNLKSSADYPEVFFMTSTNDDRVHPGHARKMARKMLDMGFRIHYYENTEGGHDGAADLKQRARWSALEYMYLYQKLMD